MPVLLNFLSFHPPVYDQLPQGRTKFRMLSLTAFSKTGVIDIFQLYKVIANFLYNE